MPIDELKPDVLDETCPSRTFMNHVTSRWGVLIFIALRDEKLRFSELRRRIGGVSEKMLSQSLKTLEQDGFVLRKSFDVVPPHVEYTLTPLGLEVSSHVKALAVCLEKNLSRIMKAHET